MHAAHISTCASRRVFPISLFRFRLCFGLRCILVSSISIPTPRPYPPPQAYTPLTYLRTYSRGAARSSSRFKIKVSGDTLAFWVFALLWVSYLWGTPRLGLETHLCAELFIFLSFSSHHWAPAPPSSLTSFALIFHLPSSSRRSQDTTLSRPAWHVSFLSMVLSLVSLTALQLRSFQ